MNKKGQALIEFVLILPIFLFILLTIFDFGIIFYTKNNLVSQSNDIVNIYNKDNSIDDIRNNYKKLTININDDGKYKKIEVKALVSLKTPLMKKILGNPYEITIERFLPNE